MGFNSAFKGLMTTYCGDGMYWLTEWSRVLLEKLTGSQLVQKFAAFYGTRRFITAFTSVRHLSLSWASSIQSIPSHPTSWISILILSSHLSLGLPSGLFPSGFPTKTLYALLLSPHTSYMPRPSHSSWFDHPNNIGCAVQSLSSSLCSFLLSPVISSPLSPNILLSTLLSNTLSLRSSLNVSNQVSHPYKTTGKIIVLYILISIFLDSKPEHKRFCTEWQPALPDCNLLLISTWIQFWFVKVVPKYLNCSNLSKDPLADDIYACTIPALHRRTFHTKSVTRTCTPLVCSVLAVGGGRGE